MTKLELKRLFLYFLTQRKRNEEKRGGKKNVNVKQSDKLRPANFLPNSHTQRKKRKEEEKRRG